MVWCLKWSSVLVTHGVPCVQYDAGRIVSGSHNKTIWVWNINTSSQAPVRMTYHLFFFFKRSRTPFNFGSINCFNESSVSLTYRQEFNYKDFLLHAVSLVHES